MSLDPLALLAILGMAAGTFATRIAGLALVRRASLSPTALRVLEVVPGAVLVALIAPEALARDPATAIAALITMVAAWRLPLMAVVAVGIAAAAGMRSLIG